MSVYVPRLPCEGINTWVNPRMSTFLTADKWKGFSTWAVPYLRSLLQISRKDLALGLFYIYVPHYRKCEEINTQLDLCQFLSPARRLVAVSKLGLLSSLSLFPSCGEEDYLSSLTYKCSTSFVPLSNTETEANLTSSLPNSAVSVETEHRRVYFGVAGFSQPLL